MDQTYSKTIIIASVYVYIDPLLDSMIIIDPVNTNEPTPVSKQCNRACCACILLKHAPAKLAWHAESSALSC